MREDDLTKHRIHTPRDARPRSRQRGAIAVSMSLFSLALCGAALSLLAEVANIRKLFDRGTANGSAIEAAETGAVRRDVEAKRAGTKAGSATRHVAAAIGRVATSRSPSTWAWIGFPTLTAAILLALLRAMARRRKEERRLLDLDATGSLQVGEWDGDDDSVERNFVVELASLGLHAEGLTAAGIRSHQVGRVIDGARRWLQRNAAQRRELDSEHLIAVSNRDRLKRLVDAGVARPEEEAELSEAIVEVEANRAEREAARRALFDTATASLPSDAKATLERILGNQEGSLLPAHYLVVDRADEEWERLAEALLAERRARKSGTELSPFHQDYLEDARSDVAVWNARVNLVESLGDVTSAWELAVSNGRTETSVAG
jgi:hypothetical protein